MNNRSRAAYAGLLALSIGLTGCSSLEPRTAYTSAESASADIPGMGTVRYFAVAPP